MSEQVVVGIDPGASGALAVVNVTDGSLLAIHDTPMVLIQKRKRVDLYQLDFLISQIAGGRSVVAWVEDVSAMPRQGVSSVFTFGFSTGALHGILVAHRVRLETVRPAVWTREIGVPGGKDGKGAHRMKAMQIYPSEAHSFSRAKDDGRADAALIAEYGRRKILHG